MEVARTDIGEHDVVALLNPVGGWPVGTEGTVLNRRPAVKFVEVSNHRGESVDFLDVPVEDLRLAWKCPSPPAAPERMERDR